MPHPPSPQRYLTNVTNASLAGGGAGAQLAASDGQNQRYPSRLGEVTAVSAPQPARSHAYGGRLHLAQW